ncbi:hypothetical protein Ddc_01087 [Ditylenchus destructor]|nr:hypothetical protein Ddc_01087 [Ditylenchus destructor]
MFYAHVTMSQKAPAGERCWDPFLKRFYLGTDTCSNSMSDYSCDILFDPDRDNNQRRIANGEPPVASPACDAPEYADVALKCAKNCYICCERPEFTCKNPRSSANFNCDLKLDKCKDHIWLDIMVEKCPRTCGLCNYRYPTKGECKDVDDFCSDKDISVLCAHATLKDRMAMLCPNTCKKCNELKVPRSIEKR